MGKTILIEQKIFLTQLNFFWIILTVQHNEVTVSPHNFLIKFPGGEFVPLFVLGFHYYVNFVQRVFLK